MFNDNRGTVITGLPCSVAVMFPPRWANRVVNRIMWPSTSIPTSLRCQRLQRSMCLPQCACSEDSWWAFGYANLSEFWNQEWRMWLGRHCRTGVLCRSLLRLVVGCVEAARKAQSSSACCNLRRSLHSWSQQVWRQLARSPLPWPELQEQQPGWATRLYHSKNKSRSSSLAATPSIIPTI